MAIIKKFNTLLVFFRRSCNADVQEKTRVAIYVRVSTTDQSCELQIQEINKFQPRQKVTSL